ncbi:MAG TPA: host attachment protein [Acetobacteraceae bacterium]|jgi:protein required for attachment to host cells|nr:host attachment protein [Acetobacteraceae bacterium]
MPTQTRLLIALADGEHARFVRPAGDNALHSTTSLDSDAAHKRSSDLRSDHPGASFHSDSSAHHAITPRHDPHEQEKMLFGHVVARQLNGASQRGEFDSLVIVAPAHALESIRGALDTTTAAKVVGTLAKDLLKTPDDELWPHVKEWVPPVHRAVPFSGR